MAEEYYNIGPELNNIDFYIGGVNAVAVLSIESSLDSSGVVIKNATSTVSLSTNISTTSSKIAFATSSIEITLVKVAASIEILNTLVDINIDVSSTISSEKIAYASSSININSNLSCLMSKTTNAHSMIDISSDVQLSPIAIKIGSPHGIDIILSSSLSVKEIVFGISTINLLSKLLVNPPIRYSPSFVDSSSIMTLFILDNKPLTNHGRKFTVSSSPIYIENINWNNRKSRYYKRSGLADRKAFSINWQFLPNYKNKTVDNRHARDFISSIADDPDVHVLKVINQDVSGLTPPTEVTYNVFVRSYSESLVRRDFTDDVYYFDCNLTLEEA